MAYVGHLLVRAAVVPRTPGGPGARAKISEMSQMSQNAISAERQAFPPLSAHQMGCNPPTPGGGWEGLAAL